MKLGSFASRHMGPRTEDQTTMLSALGLSSIDELIEKTVPPSIRLREPLNLDASLTESEYLEHVSELSDKNVTYRNYIGMGYYPTEVPSVIRRNILENPGWYTAYTPYQSEIAQGRLEALLNFQTVVIDLTGKEIANASLLDEGTAAAEAMAMLLSARPRKQAKSGATTFIVDTAVYPQTFAVMQTRAKSLGINILEAPRSEWKFTEDVYGCLLQYPDANGEVEDLESLVEEAHSADVKVVMATDLMALLMLKSPGEMGADVVVGSSQRFGVPMGYGGPHAAFFAADESYKRHFPGRIIGVSVDRHGNPALRMALQTREQHIRRDKATSNICTAQALLAVMASMYAVYHGPKGLRSIAERIHCRTKSFATALNLNTSMDVVNSCYFDTLKIKVKGGEDEVNSLIARCHALKINIRYFNDGEHVGVSLNERTNIEDLTNLCSAFGVPLVRSIEVDRAFLGTLYRDVNYLEHTVFNTHRSETAMMRYIKFLENRDFSLVHGMIPLGSCTMKLNAATELLPIAWYKFAELHPFCPPEQARGMIEILQNLESDLAEITGFDKVTLQPNSGSNGEYAGMLVIQAYHQSRGEGHRNICLIPSSAHGTNPASAAMAGLKIVVVGCMENGDIDIEDLKSKAEKHSENLSSIMITYPSTHGVYEEGILEITEMIHSHGGQVYMDGANMNAQVGLTSPGNIGADVCHLNLHKTFSIPHGGGGPGVGPIGVAAHLTKFLPGHSIVHKGGEDSISAVSSAPFGSALIALVPYAYLKMLGVKGATQATEVAILNANYLKVKLEGAYDILYQGNNNTVAHEMIIDCRDFKTFGVEVIDIAKRLIDYGFHAPTISWPVAGTMMIEPTESESLEELDRFVEALLSIREEVRDIELNKVDPVDNVLKMAPHTIEETTATDWTHPYSRERASFPVVGLRKGKFWAPVSRVNDTYGDRNLLCSCPPITNYIEEIAE
mgnify:FL=1